MFWLLVVVVSMVVGALIGRYVWAAPTIERYRYLWLQSLEHRFPKQAA
jgi:hypothetical protein